MVTRPIDDLKDIKNIPSIKNKMMEIMQFLFTNTQDNLVNDMPWGDEKRPNSKKKDTKITDKGLLLTSAIPPFWKDDNTISIQYTAPWGDDVEWGTLPRKLSDKEKKDVRSWVKRKLGIKKKKAHFIVSRNIINNIEKNGILPHPFIRPAIHSTEKRYKLRQTKMPK